MSFKSWLRGWRFNNSTSLDRWQRPHGRKTSRWTKPRLEALEYRIVPVTVTWIASGSGDWETASNWSSSPALPGPNDDVVIPALSGATITHSTGNDTVHSIASGSNVALTNGSALTVNGTVQVSSPTVFHLGHATLANAAIGNGSTLVLGGSAYQTAGLGTLSGVTIALGATLDATQLNQDYDEPGAYVTGGLTLNGTAELGASDGSTDGQLYFESASQTLSGSGTLVFGDSSNNTLYAGSPYDGSSVTLTIGSGITIKGGSGTIEGYNSGDNFVSNAAITIASGQTLTLGGANWVNKGTITANVATVNLGGSFTLAALGTFASTGGTVNLTGTLNNTGTTLALAPSLGAWRLDGGTINGGTITGTGGSTLALTGGNYGDEGEGGTLASVTVALGATLDATQYIAEGEPNATVTGSLTLYGTIRLGAANGSNYGQLYFGSASQTLSGSGNVVFGGSSENALYAGGGYYYDDASVTLTIGSGITINGGSGAIAASPYDYYDLSNTIVNNAAITIPSGQTLTLGGVNWVNNGTITANGATVNLGGSFVLADLGNFALTGATVNLTGTLSNTDNTLPLAPALGAWYLYGGTISGGTITSTGGSTLVLTGAGGTLASVTISSGVTLDGTQYIDNGEPNAIVTGGLVLNGTIKLGAANGSNYGQLNFASGSQTLSGSGTVVFGDSISNALYADGDYSSETLTIGSGITIKGGSGVIANNPSSGTLGTIINDASISIPSGQTLSLGGVNWVNNGTITANGATVNLWGSFVLASLGNFGLAGATVNLAGTLNNTGKTLPLAPSLGAWYLYGGTISGGTITSSGGSTLVLTGAGGTLAEVAISSGVTVDGTQYIDNGDAYAIVTGGLMLNGTLMQGSSNGSNYGRLYFQSGSQMLSGSGTVVFGDSGSNALYAEGDDYDESAYSVTLTLASTLTIQGGSGIIAGYYTASGNTDTIINNASITIPSRQTLTLGGVSWVNNGTITANGTTVNLGGSFTTAALGNIALTAATVNLTGTLNNTGTTLVLAPALGAWTLHGGTINGGLITTTGASTLALTDSGGALAGVTLAAGVTVDGTQNIGGTHEYASVTGGLTLYGTINLGSANGGAYGELDFYGSQTLAGGGTLTLGGSASNVFYAIGNDGNSPATLTIGGRIVVQGGSGSIKGYYTGSSGDSIVNDGTILVASGNTLNVGGTNALNSGLIGIGGGTLKLVGTKFTNTIGGLIGGHGSATLASGVTYVDNGITDWSPLTPPPSIYNVDVELTTIAITYYDPGTMNVFDVTNPANYTLLGSGGDGIYGNGNDVDQSSLISGITYNASTQTATLQLSSDLPDDFYRVEVNGTAVVDSSGTPLWSKGPQELVNRLEDETAAQVSVSLDPASDTGVSNHDGLTDDKTPTFDVQVNQAGTIGMDFEGNGTYVSTLFAPSAGTYQITAPPLPDGKNLPATVNFTAVTGSLGQGSTTYTLDTAGPRITSMSPTGSVATAVSEATVTFSKPIDSSTFTRSAITLVGPGGPITIFQPQFVSGDTYLISFPTQTVQGTYALTVASSVADLAGNLMDQNQNGINGESSDSFSGSFTIALPDLAVTSTSAPATTTPGSTIPISWTVSDVSAANPTGSTWYDSVFLSTKSVLDNTAILLTSLAGPSSPLAAGASYSRSTSVTIPGITVEGNYFLLFVANSNGGQLESDAGNDTNDVASEAIILPVPDLQVTEVSGPSTGFTGQSVLVTWTDQNKGTATATGPWVDNVYTVTDAQGDNPTLLGSFIFEENLAANASVQRIQQVILPQTPGTHWFEVVTNATQSVGEGLYFNNDTTVAANSISIVAVPLPDLVVTSITPPPDGVFSGASVPLSFVVTNQGKAPTSAPVWHDWVILSQDPNLAQTYQGQLNPTGPGGDQTLNNQPVILGFANPSYLGVGQSYQQTVNVPLPISAQGEWYVYVVPDGTGFHHPFAMPEVSRTDKLAGGEPPTGISAGFNVTLSPPPELAVSGVQAPAQDFSGTPMKLSWTVSNIGTGPTAADAWTDAVYMSSSATLDSSATLLGTFAHQGALAAGDSYTSNETVNLPVGVSGPSYYFLVKTDLNGQVFQDGATTDNVAATSSAETVNLTPPPDLAVTAIVVPGTALAGQAFTFSYTVTNTGAGSVTIAGAGATPNYTWNDALYLSPTATFDSGTAVSLGQQTHQGSLGPYLADNDSYTNNVTTTLPGTLAVGSYYLIVQTDSGNVVFELPQDKPNETAASTSAIQVSQSLPDLVVSSAGAPAEAVPGSAILVSWTVANQSTGGTVAGSWQDSVYIDTGATLDANAVLLGSYTHYGALAGGGSYTQSQPVTLPIDLLGTYNLFVVANSSGDVDESNTSNNTSAPLPILLTLQITGGGGNGNGGSGGSGSGGSQQAQVSDLQPTSLSGPATALTRGSVAVSWTVQNNGPGTTNANWWNDDVWMSTNTTLGSGGTDVYLGTVQHNNALAAGDGYSESGTFTLPAGMTAGNYYFIVAVDRPVAPPGVYGGGDLVYETDETNNELAESTATAVSVGPSPKLAVSNLTVPSTATSGQQLSVGWTVTNNGADTGNVPITDSVYLSYDQVFDPTDLYQGSVTYQGGLAAGTSYTQNASLTLRPGLAGTFYVFVVTNSNHEVYEQDTSNNIAYDVQPVQIQLSPPADLVAGAVTIPANAVPGESISLTYQVTNNGSNAANGTWYDSLYLSSTTTWSIDDPLLGRVTQTQDLAPGHSYTGSLTAPLPGVAPGSYYVILRSNILDNIPEQTLSNNLSASLTQSSLDAPSLTLITPTNGVTPTDGTLNQGQSAYWKVDVQDYPEQTVQVILTGEDAAAYNELYVSFGTMPTRSSYDYRYSQPFTANQEITVPTTQAGAYYVLVYGDTVPSAPENYTIAAKLIPFSIQTVSPTQAGTGPVTLTISGAQFNFSTTFQLHNASGSVLDATRTLLQDSATAYATFDLTSASLGSYDVWATQSDGTTSTDLPAGLSVVAVAQPGVKIGLVVPQAILVAGTGTITVTYTNPGNTDLPAPLILLDGTNALFQVPGQSTYTGSKLQLIGGDSAGPFGTLPPGFQGSISVSFQPITTGAGVASDFTVATLQDPTQPFDWNALSANDVPLGTSAQQWSALVNLAEPLMGSTWGDVVTFLDTNSIQLVKNVAGEVDPSALNSLYNFDGLLQYTVAVYGSNSPTPATPSFPVVKTKDEVTLYNAKVDGSGNPVPLNASYPTFVIIPGFGGYQADDGALAQAIAADTVCFPNGQVNVLIAAWQGATAGPTIDGIAVPWLAALHVDNVGLDLGDLLNSLDQQGEIGFSTTTVLGEGLGSYVGNQAAKIVGGLENVIALNPASAYGGYLPPSLKVWFAHSTAYETSSLFDTQLSIAASIQTLPTGDLNNPLLQSTFGVSWLTGQVQDGNCYLLNPSYTAGPDVLPPGNDPPPPSYPAELVVSSAELLQIAAHDPNLIIGPQGSGTSGCVSPSQPLPYTIVFTNLPTVPAPAQKVVVEESIDPPNLDWRTFRLTSFAFAGNTYSIPVNSAFYQTTIDLTKQDGFDVQFTATIDESTGIATWTFATIDPATGQAPLDPTIGLLPPNNNNGIGEGSVSYTIMATPSDPTGTLITAEAGITFDSQPPLETPEISNTVDAGTGLTSSVTTLPTYETSKPFNVSWSGSDASNGSGVASFTVYVSDNGGPYKPWLTNTTLSSAPFAGQDGHTYSFYSVATDNAGNLQPTPNTAQASTLLDSIPPATTALGSPASGSSYSAGAWTGTIVGTAGDAISGVQQEQVSILDRATGQYWNGTSFSSNSEYLLPATLANPGTDSTTWSVSFPTSDFPADGFYSVHALATNGAGNIESAGLTSTFSYDTVPPVTTDALTGTPGDGGWFRSAVSVTLTARDATSGVAATYYELDDNRPSAFQVYNGVLNVTSQGDHTVYYYSVDMAGNVEATESDSFRIDSVAPNTTDTLTGTQGANGWYTSATVSVGLTAIDPSPGSDHVITYYALDDNGPGAFQVYNGEFTVAGDGSHPVYFYSVDAAGNTEAVESVSVNIDSVKPITTVTSLAGTQGTSSWYTSGVAVTLTANDAPTGVGSGVAVTYYTIDTGSQQTYTGSAFLVSSQGDHTIYFYSVDVAGNVEATESDSFQIDSVAPNTTDTLTGTQGTDGWYTSATVSVALTAIDPSPGSDHVVTYYALGDNSPGAFQVYNGDFTVTGDGSHPVYFYSVDAAGNTEAVESVSVNIDSVKPITTITSLAGTQGTNGWYTSGVTVTLAASDATSGVAATYYSLDNGKLQRYTGPFTVLGDTIHPLEFYSVDNAGNEEIAGPPVMIPIDTTAPTLTLPANQTFETTQLGGALANYVEAISSDNESMPTLTYSPPPGSLFSPGTTWVEVTATDAAGNQSQGSFLVTVLAPADHLVIGDNPAQVTAGSTFSAAVYAEDAYGNIDPNYSDSAALSLSTVPAGGTLSGVAIEPIQNGVATFSNLSITSAGNDSLLAASPSDLIAGTAPVSVTPAPQFKVTVTPVVAGVTDVGSLFTVTITAMLNKKQFTNYTGTVLITSTDPDILLDPITFQPSDLGTTTLPTLSFSTPGKQTFTVSDVTLPNATWTSNAVILGNAPLSIDHFTVTGLPASVVSGTSHMVTITAVNAAGLTVPKYTGTVQISSSDSVFNSFQVPFTATNKGVVRIPVTLTSLGRQSLTATDLNTDNTGTEPNILVVSPATKLNIIASTTNIKAGGQVTLTVKGLTAAKTTDTLIADTLQVTTSDPRATVAPGTMTNGMQTFIVMFLTAGTQKVVVTDSSTRPAIQGSVPISVSAGGATQLSVTGVPLFAVTGTSQHVTVTAEDKYGNRVMSGFTDTVQLAGQSYPFNKAGDHGSHVFTVTMNGETPPLTATDITPNTNVQPGSGGNVTVVSASAALTTDKTTLIVLAPAGGGTVVITPANAAGTSVSVMVNGKTVSGGPFAPTGYILVYGQGGNDVFKEVTATFNGQQATVAIPSILLGGSGNDMLSVAGSSVGNVLVGGTGTNTLTGGGGPDILIGGGSSTLHAGKGGDVLIGGSTIWDANVAALAALLAEWSRTDMDYLDRLHDLFGDGSGGLNGSYLLDPQTVIRDTAISQLFGGPSGKDWFWLSDSVNAVDRLSGYAKCEVVTFE